MRELHGFNILQDYPAVDHYIMVYDHGTTDLVTGLTDMNGVAIPNPFQISDVGSVFQWYFKTPSSNNLYDVFWVEGNQYLSRGDSSLDHEDLVNLGFKTGLNNPVHKEGLLFYDKAKWAMSYYNQIAGVTVNLGQEVLFPVYNGSGADILNGTVVSPDATGIIPADNHMKERCRLIAVVTHDIPDGTWGYVTRIGQVGGLDTSPYTEGQILYLGNNGAFATAPPMDGSYSIIVGVVDVVDPTEGIITVDVNISELTVEVTDTNGFPPDIKAATTLSKDDVSRTFTITPTGDDFHCYVRGDKHEFTEAQSVNWTDVEGNHWFYVNAEGLQHLENPTPAQRLEVILGYAYIGSIYWNATDKKVEFDIFEERHGISMSPQTHAYLHLTRGAQYYSGFAVGDILVDQNGSQDTHAQFSVTAGVFFDEDITHEGDAFAVGDTMDVAYILGSGGDLRVGTQAGFAVLNAPAGRVYYNQFTGGAWQLTEVPDRDFVLYHIFAVNGYSKKIVSIMGQSTHGTSSAARAAASSEIANILSGMDFDEMTPLATIIFQTRNTYGNSVKARTISTDTGDDYVDWRTSELAQGSPASSHANLTNLLLAGTGVTWGHIDDQAQDIYGLKRFVNGVQLQGAVEPVSPNVVTNPSANQYAFVIDMNYNRHNIDASALTIADTLTLTLANMKAGAGVQSIVIRLVNGADDEYTLEFPAAMTAMTPVADKVITAVHETWDDGTTWDKYNDVEVQ